MIEQREEFMVPPSLGVSLPKFRKSHFLKPILNPDEPAPQKPHSDLPLPSNNPILVTKSVLFRGRIRVQNGWKDWVDNLEPTHQETWKKAGIIDAIRVSTYSIKRHDELLFWLAQNWCSETNTFIFSWGETTIALEDVLILGGFSVHNGDSIENPESKTLEDKLVKNLSKFKKYCNHSQWMRHFKGKGGELENAALIVLWLSRYVFSTGYYAMISPNVFSIAASLARGSKIALGYSVLASIYRDMSLLRHKIATFTTNDDSKLVLWAPLQFLQVWAWERFPTLSPKPFFLDPGKPRLARWHNVKNPKQDLSLWVDIEFNGGNFVWRPYALHLENWVFPNFYLHQERWMLMNSDVGEEFQSWARCMKACELVGLDFVEKYHPHRVGMQFGMDQDIPSFLSPCSYHRQLDGLKVYFPHHWFEGEVTMRYSLWWRDMHSLQRQKRAMSDVVESPLTNEDAQQCHENISLKTSENLGQEDTQNCQEMRIDQGEDEEQKRADHMKLNLGNTSEENSKLDNVVIIDDDEEEQEEDRNKNPLDAMYYALKARIEKVKLVISRIKAAR